MFEKSVLITSVITLSVFAILTSNSCKKKVGLDCYDPSLAEPMNCPMNIDPVIGCDGKTYGNACEAKSVGVKWWTPAK